MLVGLNFLAASLRFPALVDRAVSQEIYMFANGRIVHLPNTLPLVAKAVAERIIRGDTAVVPEDMQEFDPHTKGFLAPTDSTVAVRFPLLARMQYRSGTYAILMAFRAADAINPEGRSHTLR
jgi:hypothetical protein